ncbi:hypothetical protein UC34_00695 [Pandoraea vervacti]|uniref:Uncharacterized protein n=2 Tax=Pandoraea vervacti TaxID=656178 RepID=A0ABN4FKC0_9BURK|nr:hypothetical protein UC34_00695 [Pandoraea vervacti]
MRVPPSVSGDFWALSPQESEAGVAHFDYVRRDIETSRLDSSVGFILADRPSAAGNGQPYELLCGCPPPGSIGGPPCDDCPGQLNRVGVSPWDTAAPEALAVQAIFYDVGNGGQLSTALEYQRGYYDRSKRWLPVLRVAFGPQGTTAFGYDERDQLDYGFTTVENLNTRYADTRHVCPDGRAGYACDGVVIRVTGWGTTFHSWNPSPGSVASNGVPFSYIRADAHVDRLYWHTNDAGMILREFGAPTEHPSIMRCIYAEDTGTGARDRCYDDYPQLCNAMGITSIAAYIAHHKPYVHCAFDIDPASFQLSLDVRPRIPPGHPWPWNEAIVALWPQDVPLQIGIEAFFYMNGEVGGAQFVQRDYMAITGHFMPIVSVDLKAANGRIFTYDPAVQSFSLMPAEGLPPVPMNPRDIPE